jgi:hypothetical protein
VYWSKQPVEREGITASLYNAIEQRHEGSSTETKAGRDEVEVMKYDNQRSCPCLILDSWLPFFHRGGLSSFPELSRCDLWWTV